MRAQIREPRLSSTAYDCVVNGKPALERVMERQSVTTNKDSDITNDAKLWVTETMSNPKYSLELFLQVVTVGLETMKVVEAFEKPQSTTEKALEDLMAKLEKNQTRKKLQAEKGQDVPATF